MIRISPVKQEPRNESINRHNNELFEWELNTLPSLLNLRSTQIHKRNEFSS